MDCSISGALRVSSGASADLLSRRLRGVKSQETGKWYAIYTSLFFVFTLRSLNVNSQIIVELAPL